MRDVWDSMAPGRRFGSLALLVAALMGGLAGAQTPALVSTIQPPESAASRVDRALRKLAADEQWRFEPLPCSVLAGALAGPGPMAALTTADCLDGVTGADGVSVSANVGAPAYFFALGSAPADVFKSGNTIGILNSVDQFRFRLRDAIRSLLSFEMSVDSGSSGYAELVAGLRGGRFQAVCVIDDGTGTALEYLNAAASDARSPIPIRLVSPSSITASSVMKVRLADRDAVRAIGVSPRFVATPWQPARADSVAAVLAFPVEPVRADKSPDTSSSLVARLWNWGVVEAAGRTTRDLRPLPAVAPILVTKGAVPLEVGETVKRALLAAPVDALINPCRPDHQEMYRSFLRAALGDASAEPFRVAAIWEHAALLESRKDGDQAYARQKTHMESKALSESERSRLVRAFDDRHEAGACHPPRRSVFRNNKLAYYQHGIRRLRDSLAEPIVDPRSQAFQEASACLRLALDERDGRAPTCGEKLNGMWTTYYAPYIALAVIETEDLDARK